MIHYHGTPCGGKREEVQRFLAGRHSLIPWPRPEDIAVAANVCQSFCLDNGAFTAWKSGEPVTNWTGYYEWVLEWHQHPGFDFAIIPDVIDGTEQDNDRQLEKWINWKEWPRRSNAAFIGAPVWHLHESLERLQQLCKSWPRVCLGSSGQWATPGTDGWWERMECAMEACCVNGRPMAKLHGLRMLSQQVFPYLPLSSADSTNAVQNSNLLGRFGTYKQPTSGQRMQQIANCIESQQSAACWESTTCKQGRLWA